MGMTEFETGHMAVFGGLNMDLHGTGVGTMPKGVGSVIFENTSTAIKAKFKNSSLKKSQHVYSIMVVHATSGNPLPLYYTKHTHIVANNDIVEEVSIEFEKGQVKGQVIAYCIVDTYPVAAKSLQF